MSLNHRCGNTDFVVYLLYSVFLFKPLRDKLLIITQVDFKSALCPLGCDAVLNSSLATVSTVLWFLIHLAALIHIKIVMGIPSFKFARTFGSVQQYSLIFINIMIHGFYVCRIINAIIIHGVRYKIVKCLITQKGETERRTKKNTFFFNLGKGPKTQ